MIHSNLFGGEMKGVTDFVMVEGFNGERSQPPQTDHFFSERVEEVKRITMSTVAGLNRTLTGQVIANVAEYLFCAAFPASSCLVVPLGNYLYQKREKTVLTREKIVKPHVQQVK